MYIKTLSVTELNGYLKKVMDNDFILNNIRVQGEISNLKYHNSGHIYFSLKDENSKINCIMFKSNADYLNIPLNNGRKVEAVGRISVYIKDGSYQLYVSTINDIGMGELYIKFNNLKEKLSKKGLFLEEIKKEIPKYVFKIGVITSPTGAAVKDIIQVAKRRNPGTEIIIYPALVQGNEASESIINGINTLSSMEDIDVIVVARGGGSIEELWAFNDEKLAYAIYNCRIPIISGVGHETDFTICDFAADKRAATPSQAAEIAVMPQEELFREVFELKEELHENINEFISEGNRMLELYKRTLENYNPMNYIVHRYSEVDNCYDKLKGIIANKINKGYLDLEGYKNLLDAYNPLNVLNKGYSVVYQRNKIIKSVEDYEIDKETTLRFYNGTVNGKFIAAEKEIE